MSYLTVTILKKMIAIEILFIILLITERLTWPIIQTAIPMLRMLLGLNRVAKVRSSGRQLQLTATVIVQTVRIVMWLYFSQFNLVILTTLSLKLLNASVRCRLLDSTDRHIEATSSGIYRVQWYQTTTRHLDSRDFYQLISSSCFLLMT